MTFGETVYHFTPKKNSGGAGAQTWGAGAKTGEGGASLETL